ncbi:MAG: hypothetical protein K9M99_06310 [Candidatus Cloacimonetes bacterium]|nr:hypothetical protein [Candidatus Cloacimonadota bacterium]
MNKDIVIIIGAYGSGKSEYAINYVWQLKQQEIPVTLVDLDVVNPYFRSREVREDFARQDIIVIAPDGEYTHADMPMLSPRIMGAVQDISRKPVLDVGGDPAGCRTLARYVQNIKNRGYQLKVVINTKRPFTSDHKGIIQLLESLEYSSRLKVTELVCNTNLMEYTDEAAISDGIKIISGVAEELKLKFSEYLVMEKYADRIPENLLGKKRVLLQYYLNKPWEKSKVHGVI